MRYLLITFFRKPGGQIDEMVKVTKKVKSADYSTCNVIMDYGLKNIEKCVVEGRTIDKDFNRLHDYYYKVYPSLIDQLMKDAPLEVKDKAKK